VVTLGKCWHESLAFLWYGVTCCQSRTDIRDQSATLIASLVTFAPSRDNDWRGGGASWLAVAHAHGLRVRGFWKA